jgi:cell division protein FtsI (penicillin-binding protein 3)
MSTTKRFYTVLAALAIVVLVVVGRLVDLQVVQRDKIIADHIALFGGTQELEPIRGKIVDRNGALLAVTDFKYRISASPNNIEDPLETATLLSSILVTRTHALLPLIDPLPREGGKPVLYSVVAPRVSKEVAQAVLDAALPGIGVEPIADRYYPQGEFLSHVLGWADIDMNGRSGLEDYYDAELAGDAVTVWQFPFLFGQWSTPNPHHGATLRLTVDRTVQYVAEKVLADALVRYQAPSGSIIVMDPRTFGILAMANLPAFDPNDFYKEDPESLVNASITQRFEPGSIHKVLTMAAAIDSGTVTPERTYNDTGAIEVGGIPIYNWDRAAHGTTDMVTLLAESLNVGAATIATWMGQETFYGYMEAFGLGEYTGIDLAAEINGWLKRPGDTMWTESELGTNSFGQGLAVTPLEELTAIAAIANHGVMLKPHLVAEVWDGERVTQLQPTAIGQPISERSAGTVTRMMAQALAREVNSAQVPGYMVAGKTGTAQIAQGGIYHPTDVICTFVGFVPADDPQVIALIKIDRPQISLGQRWGSMTAAPTFAELMRQLVVILDIPPDAVRVANNIGP